jgi:N-acetylmuramoyl-L-alanine amidase
MMRRTIGLLALGSIAIVSPVRAENGLFVAYPPAEHTTSADRIFLIGTAPPSGEVLINGQAIERSRDGHFAPSFPLEPGENIFTLKHGSEQLQIKVTRQITTPTIPEGLQFAENSLTPTVDLARMPGELLCFSAIAPSNASVSVSIGRQTVNLFPQLQTVELPSNLSALIDQNNPQVRDAVGYYEGCTEAPSTPGDLGQPTYRLTLDGQSKTQRAPGAIAILSPTQFEIAEVTAESGVARTGPSTNHSRMTPLPKGTRAAITGREAEWVRLDYGAWIKAEEVQVTQGGAPPRAIVRSLGSREVPKWTEIIFPLQTAVPVTVRQDSDRLVLTLHNTTAQTDTFRLNDGPVVERMDWQPFPDRAEYTLHLKNKQSWGYKLRYEGTSLILSLRHPPRLSGDRSRPLAGVEIAIDPGHGSPNDLGARGPTGYPEKDVTAIVSKLLRDALVARGATVYMTREGDEDLWPHERVATIEAWEPHLALSVHYNALPDAGDAINTKGIGMFWYNPQAHDLSVFLHQYLVEQLNRPSYGVFWNNLALTRPTVAPSVLMELGFMINPDEFEWITDPQEQEKLAEAIAEAVSEWVRSKS